MTTPLGLSQICKCGVSIEHVVEYVCNNLLTPRSADHVNEIGQLSDDVGLWRPLRTVTRVFDIDCRRQPAINRRGNLQKVRGLVFTRPAERKKVICTDIKTCGCSVACVCSVPAVDMVSPFGGLHVHELDVIGRYFSPIDRSLMMRNIETIGLAWTKSRPVARNSFGPAHPGNEDEYNNGDSQPANSPQTSSGPATPGNARISLNEVAVVFRHLVTLQIGRRSPSCSAGRLQCKRAPLARRPLFRGGGDGIRTHYLLDATEALYQVSYAPEGT